MTVDGAATRDVDDAFSLEQIAAGWRLCVAIANPASLVQEGSSTDRDARERAATVYHGVQVRKGMLPSRISETDCNLVEGESRPAVVFAVELSRDFVPRSLAIAESTVRVDHRLTYDDVPVLARSSDTTPLGQMVRAGCAVAKGLFDARRRNGALAFLDEVRGLMTGEDGNLLTFDRP